MCECVSVCFQDQDILADKETSALLTSETSFLLQEFQDVKRFWFWQETHQDTVLTFGLSVDSEVG